MKKWLLICGSVLTVALVVVLYWLQFPTLPRTVGEKGTSSGYVPVDGLRVDIRADSRSCGTRARGRIVRASELQPVLEILPDISVRFAVAQIESEGELNYGPSRTTVRGKNYKAVLDYVNVDAVPTIFWVRRVGLGNDGAIEAQDIYEETISNKYQYEVLSSEAIFEKYKAEVAKEIDAEYALRPENLPETDFYERIDALPGRVNARAEKDWYRQITIPVYVGVGLRLSADIRALKNGVELTGLGSIGAQAQTGGLSGTMTVQTLGLSGGPVATALPLPSKLDQTTIENAIMALGSSRSIMFASRPDEDGGMEVAMTPRVVGLYAPIQSDPKLIAAIYTELANHPPPWDMLCREQELEVRPQRNDE